ncbi:cyclic nucleotide-binding domain-containing protein [Thermithiobacillus tepidarius DSM 3134]|uniref:Crp/Fnr family transcriptional regulator n=1 Tax=Thermithiobacillus tepidarius TaxID=929 RepID=UPI00138AEE9E|nr:cyclic nucleotide-binding domain-containing protein [Thermithiobacillus tepidarius]
MAEQLGREGVRALQDLMRPRRVPIGTVVIQDQGPVDALYLVMEGVCSVAIEERGCSIRLGRFGPGQWLGEVALFSGERTASATVLAETALQLLELKYDDFERLKREQEAVAGVLTHVLIGVMAERLRASDEALREAPDGQWELPACAIIAQDSGDPGAAWFKLVLRKLAGAEGGQ